MNVLKAPWMRLLQWLVWSGLILFVLLVWGFARSNQDTMTCRELQIRFNPEEEMTFTDRDDIAKMIGGDSTMAAMQGKPLGDYDVGYIEEKLETNPFIRNAEVYLELNGVLKIEIEQRRPVLRLFRQGSAGFYVDADGRKMPLSERYTAPVIVVRGYIAEPYSGSDTVRDTALIQAWEIARFLHADEFWSRYMDEILVDQAGEFTLIPKIGNHRIFLGNSADLDEKLYRLKLFYRHAMNKMGWSAYKVINLKYSGQVVCEKW